MKKFWLLTVLLLFTINTVTVSAWAFECPNRGQKEVVDNPMMDMPCHEKQTDETKDIEHCKGLCLCLHMTLSKTFMTVPETDALLLSGSPDFIAVPGPFFKERVPRLLERPPKRFS